MLIFSFFFCLFSFQLATLGACQCRGKKQEPCACARAAVDAKRDIAKLKHEVIKFRVICTSSSGVTKYALPKRRAFFHARGTSVSNEKM